MKKIKPKAMTGGAAASLIFDHIGHFKILGKS